jgi:hypothetical protein
LFRAAHLAVPFVDVINTMMDASLPLTVGEYLEWGDPNQKAAYDYMRSYSPYDNLERRAYPAILVTTSFNDSQVMYWEPAKYVARLRTLKTDANPLLLKIKMEPAGHGGAVVRVCVDADASGDYEIRRGELRARSDAAWAGIRWATPHRPPAFRGIGFGSSRPRWYTLYRATLYRNATFAF